MGPQGVGIMILAPQCRPLTLREGGTGSSSLQLTQPMEMPDLYESGTPATPAIAGLWAAIDFVSRFEDTLIDQEQQLREFLLQGLSSIPGIRLLTSADPSISGTGTVSFTFENIDSSAAGDLLEKHWGIACRPGLHCAPLIHKALGTERNGAIRFSIGAFTTEREIRRAISAVSILSRKV
jgi:selenocysteine lyase/cysteine desulfurase